MKKEIGIKIGDRVYNKHRQYGTKYGHNYTGVVVGIESGCNGRIMVDCKNEFISGFVRADLEFCKEGKSYA
tara:strand:+ start:473 stop:685 length:213 start_codon:yes stop_codon:yes gene_type:complete